ncbi:MAG: hypothetical protein IPK63_18940 [Candidatus Competibacteraceae bacterium]|nr:hypothetical protein [Candidatus Competibacteraceae bacterium]MBK8184841.1 hypothetical protein [Candidatus Competibacteraceae bacterium]
MPGSMGGGDYGQAPAGLNPGEAAMNLSRLMYAGHAGGSTMVGVGPTEMILALGSKFDVVSAHIPGVYDRELRCYDPATGLRLRVLYRQDRNGCWQYQPVAVRPRCCTGITAGSAS